MNISDMLVFYGYLNSFNSAVNLWNNEKVAQEMAKYGVLVFGDGVQDPGHPDYANTSIIIPRIKAFNPSVQIFGYVALPDASFNTKVDQWNTLGVQGIFIDEAGYDYGQTRAQFNTKVDYIHGRSSAKICFVNAWNMDHIVGVVNDPAYPNSTYNASLAASNLQASDWYMLESFTVNTTAYAGSYASASDFKARGDKAVSYRTTYNLRIASANIINDSNVSGQSMFNFCWNSALAYNLDAVGSSDSNYGAGSAATKFWSRPRINLACLTTTPAVIQDGLNANRYFRYGRNGRAVIDFTSNAQTSTVEKW